MSFEIVSFEKKQINRGIFKSKMVEAAIAHIKLENGSSIFVSRFNDESDWTADSTVSPNGFVIYSNGEGSRVTMRRVVREKDIVEELDRLNK